MLRALMDKVGSMQEQMSDVSRGMETIRMTKILEIKNTITEMNNVFDELLVVWTWLRQRISELDISIVTSKTEKQREKMTGVGGRGSEQIIQEK